MQARLLPWHCGEARPLPGSAAHHFAGLLRRSTFRTSMLYLPDGVHDNRCTRSYLILVACMMATTADIVSDNENSIQ